MSKRFINPSVCNLLMKLVFLVEFTTGDIVIELCALLCGGDFVCFCFFS